MSGDRAFASCCGATLICEKGRKCVTDRGDRPFQLWMSESMSSGRANSANSVPPKLRYGQAWAMMRAGPANATS